MTDERMDARLRAAGQRWRAGTDGDTALAEVPEIDEELLAPPRRRRTWLVAAAGAAVVALVAGLAIGLRGQPRHAPPSADTAGLQGVVWLLQGAPGTRSTATFYVGHDGNLVADDECRLIAGHASVTASRLTVSDPVVRYKGCTDQYGPGFYDSGTKLLRGSSAYSIDSSGLTIKRGSGSLHFVPAAKAVPPPSLDVPTLTDTTWRAPDGKTLRIDAASGTISGTICAGRATVAGPAVTFTGCGPTGQGTYLASISGTALTLEAQTIDPGFSGMSPQLTFQWEPTSAVIDPSALTDHIWTLDAVAGRPASAGTLKIADGTAAVDDGCRSFTAPATVTRGTFTMRAHAPAHPCSDAAGTVDSLLSSDPAAWVVRGGRLIVYGGGSQSFSLVYGTVQQTSTNALQGAWTLVKVFDANGVVRPLTAEAQVTIGADGSMRGTDGCRKYIAPTAVHDDGATADFSLTILSTTTCPPIVAQTADLVDRVLSGRASVIVRPGLLIVSMDEIGRLVFTGATTAGPNPQLLTAHSWQITTVTFGNGHFRHGAAVQDGGATLTFTGDTYRIEHPCSIVSGSARLAPGVATFATWNTDDHSCPPPPAAGSVRDEAAQAIDRILTGQVRWSIDGSVLTLTGTRGSVRAVGGLPADLTGSRWRLVSTAHSASNRRAVGSVVLSFPSDRQLTVDRCYTSGAQVEVGDSSLVVVDLHTTIARPCPSGPPGTQQQNRVIDSVLAGEVMWSIDASRLTLSADGASLTFRR